MNNYFLKSFTAISLLGFGAVHAEPYYDNNYFSDAFNRRIGKAYTSVNVGLSSVDDADFNFTPGVDVETDFDSGLHGSVEFGRNIGPVAFIDNVKLGLEASYAENEVDSHQAGGVQLSGSDGDLKTGTVMANMYHEFNTNSRFVPYYGVGVGAAYLNADNFRTNATGKALDDEDVAFAYQGTAGVNYMLSPQTDLGVRYRYLATEGAEMTGEGFNAEKEDFDYRNHLMTVNYTVQF